MLESVSENGHKIEQCQKYLKDSMYPLMLQTYRLVASCSDIILDHGFKVFYEYCKTADIPVVVVSRRVMITIVLVLSFRSKRRRSVSFRYACCFHAAHASAECI